MGSKKKIVEIPETPPELPIKTEGINLTHGTTPANAELIRKNGFEIAKTGQSSNGALLGEGVYLDKTGGEGAKLYGQEVLQTKIKPGLNLWKGNIHDLYTKETNYGEPAKITAFLKKQGYDGVEGVNQISIFDPKNVEVIQTLQPTKFISTAGAEVGTIKDFPKELKQKWVRGVDQYNQGKDLFFSADKGVAGDYGYVRKIRPDELPKNPLVINGSKEEFTTEIGYNEQKWGTPFNMPKSQPLTESYDYLIKKYAQAKGFDGIIYTDGSMNSPELVIFKK